MSSSTPISRAELQAIPVQRRLDAIDTYLAEVSQNVYIAAARGTTSFFADIPTLLHPPSAYSYLPSVPVTAFDLLEGLKAKYPDSCVMFYEKSVPTNRPGVTEQQTGILIDWS